MAARTPFFAFFGDGETRVDRPGESPYGSALSRPPAPPVAADSVELNQPNMSRILSVYLSVNHQSSSPRFKNLAFQTHLSNRLSKGLFR